MSVSSLEAAGIQSRDRGPSSVLLLLAGAVTTFVPRQSVGTRDPASYERKTYCLGTNALWEKCKEHPRCAGNCFPACSSAPVEREQRTDGGASAGGGGDLDASTEERGALAHAQEAETGASRLTVPNGRRIEADAVVTDGEA